MPKLKNDVIASLKEVRGSKYDSYLEVSWDDLDIIESKVMCVLKELDRTQRKNVLLQQLLEESKSREQEKTSTSHRSLDSIKNPW